MKGTNFVSPVQVKGVGTSFYHFELDDCPGIAVTYKGQNIDIGYFKITNSVKEVSDFSSIYGGRDLANKGIWIHDGVSHNNQNSLGGTGTQFIYEDDRDSGILIERIFSNNTGSGIQAAMFKGNGGTDHIVRNCIAWGETLAYIQVDSISGWQTALASTDIQDKLAAVDFSNPNSIFNIRYPEVRALVDANTRPDLDRNIIVDNVAYNTTLVEGIVNGSYVGLEGTGVTAINNSIIDYNPGFRDPDNGDFTISRQEWISDPVLKDKQYMDYSRMGVVENPSTIGLNVKKLGTLSEKDFVTDADIKGVIAQDKVEDLENNTIFIQSYLNELFGVNYILPIEVLNYPATGTVVDEDEWTLENQSQGFVTVEQNDGFIFEQVSGSGGGLARAVNKRFFEDGVQVDFFLDVVSGRFPAQNIGLFTQSTSKGIFIEGDSNNIIRIVVDNNGTRLYNVDTGLSKTQDYFFRIKVIKNDIEYYSSIDGVSYTLLGSFAYDMVEPYRFEARQKIFNGQPAVSKVSDIKIFDFATVETMTDKVLEVTDGVFNIDTDKVIVDRVVESAGFSIPGGLGDKVLLDDGNTKLISEFGGGSTDYISDITLNGTDLEVTGIGNAFNNTVDLSSIGNNVGVQDNIPKFINVETVDFTLTDIANEINLLPAFTVADTDNIYFKVNIENEPDKGFAICVLNNIGKGSYGAGATQILATDLQIISYLNLTVKDVENAANTQLIALGDIGNITIEQGFNQHTFTGTESPVQSQNDGYVLVIATISTVPTQYLFIGQSGNYGIGGTEIALASDFSLIIDDFEKTLLSQFDDDIGATDPVVKNTIFVDDILGSDLTGLPQTSKFPFQTLDAAFNYLRSQPHKGLNWFVETLSSGTYYYTFNSSSISPLKGFNLRNSSSATIIIQNNITYLNEIKWDLPTGKLIFELTDNTIFVGDAFVNEGGTRNVEIYINELEFINTKSGQPTLGRGVFRNMTQNRVPTNFFRVNNFIVNENTFRIFEQNLIEDTVFGVINNYESSSAFNRGGDLFYNGLNFNANFTIGTYINHSSIDHTIKGKNINITNIESPNAKVILSPAFLEITQNANFNNVAINGAQLFNNQAGLHANVNIYSPNNSTINVDNDTYPYLMLVNASGSKNPSTGYSLRATTFKNINILFKTGSVTKAIMVNDIRSLRFGNQLILDNVNIFGNNGEAIINFQNQTNNNPTVDFQCIFKNSVNIFNNNHLFTWTGGFDLNRSDEFIVQENASIYHDFGIIAPADLFPTIAQFNTYQTVKSKEIKITSNKQIVNRDLFSTKTYIIDGNIVLSAGEYITIPVDGLTLQGYGFDVSKISKNVVGESIFNSPVGGSGNFISNFIEYSSGDGQVFDIVDATGFNAIELNDINFVGSSNLGEIDSYRQLTATTCGIYGCGDGLTLSGAWTGFKVTNTNVFGFGATGTLLKEGTALTFNNRVFLDFNLDLPTGAVITDFQASNFNDDELLQFNSCNVKLNGIIDAVNNTPLLIPNLTKSDDVSYWTNNIGLTNTLLAIESVTQGGVEVSLVDGVLPLASGGAGGTADGKNINILRANDIEDVAPTALEAPSPINGNTAEIKLNSFVENWSYQSGAWVKKFSYIVNKDTIGVFLSALGADLTTGATATIEAPYDFTLVSAFIAVTDAPTGGNLVVDFLKNGASITSTNASIEANEFNSLTGISPVFTTTSFVKGDRITHNIIQVGTLDTGRELKSYLEVIKI